MISGQSVALSLAALYLGEDGLVTAVLFTRTFRELLRVEKTFTVQFSEPSLQILGGFAQITWSRSSQLLCLGVFAAVASTRLCCVNRKRWWWYLVELILLFYYCTENNKL